MKATIKHTPGPWLYQGNIIFHSPNNEIDRNKGHGVPSKNVIHWAGTTPEEKANARLIAAAPEMYAIIKNLISTDGNEGTELHDFSMIAAIKLLKKIDNEQTS